MPASPHIAALAHCHVHVKDQGKLWRQFMQCSMCDHCTVGELGGSEVKKRQLCSWDIGENTLLLLGSLSDFYSSHVQVQCSVFWMTFRVLFITSDTSKTQSFNSFSWSCHKRMFEMFRNKDLKMWEDTVDFQSEVREVKNNFVTCQRVVRHTFPSRLVLCSCFCLADNACHFCLLFFIF